MSDQEFWDEEIHGFTTPGEYLRFARYIDEMIGKGILEELPADPTFIQDMIAGGRWFRHKSSGTLWRLVPPDFPFRGLWGRLSLQ